MAARAEYSNNLTFAAAPQRVFYTVRWSGFRGAICQDAGKGRYPWQMLLEFNIKMGTL